jgi:flagellar biogenesis protein FliO
MSKHEIRLRRHKFTSHGAERFRNYGAVLHRHEQEQKMRKIFRVFGYFLVILIVILLIVIVTRVEKRVAPKPAETASHAVHKPLHR